MGEVNYYLKKAEENSGKSLIYLQYKFKGEKFVYSFGETIDPKNWNKKKQRVKSNTVTTQDSRYSLNDLLDNLSDQLLAAYNTELKNGIPLKAALKKHLDAFLYQNRQKEQIDRTKPSLFSLIDKYISGEIKKKKGKEKSTKTFDNYKAIKVHLQDYERLKNYRVDFDTITLDFFNSYIDFLSKGYSIMRDGKVISVKLKPNTINKDVNCLKAFMNKAVSLGYTDNLSFKHPDFSYSEEETDAVYLKDHEIEKLWSFEIDNKKLDNAKDLFVFGCFVGLRFSDFSNVRRENIMEEEGDKYIKIITQKTGELVVIPCHPIVLQIFEKYKDSPNQLPKSISNQKLNQYIKEVCKMAGFSELGRLTTQPAKPLFECISSHTCRRSFASNLYLQGFPPKEIMKITGHKTEESFNRYIRLTKLDSAKRLNDHIKNIWSKKINTVVTQILTTCN